MEQLEINNNVEFKVGEINFDKEAIKNEVASYIKKFDNLVIVDESEVKNFKTIRAGLNNVVKTIDTKRKAIKTQFNAPLTAFEKDVKEITSMINDVNSKIDIQIKAFEDQAKARKKELVDEYIAKHSLTEYADMIFKDEWLNKTYSITTIDDELEAIRNKIDGDLLAIDNFSTSSVEKAEILNDYNKCLDLSAVINAYNERKQVIQEAAKSEDENAYTITLELKATKGQMELIKDLLVKLQVEYKRVK